MCSEQAEPAAFEILNKARQPRWEIRPPRSNLTQKARQREAVGRQD
jgi:hypothetical protein